MLFSRLSDSALPGGEYLWGLFLLTAGLIAALITYVQIRRKGERTSLKQLIHKAWAPHVWFRRSSRVDIKLGLMHKLLQIMIAAPVAFSIAFMANETSRLIGGVVHLPVHADYGLGTCILVTLLAVLAKDFAVYVSHALHHTVPLLWSFHRVHHSAERMTPLTAAREHPLETLFKNGFIIAIAGPLQGVISLCFGGADLLLLFGANAFYVIFGMLVANFRHSHLWINFPKPLSLILVSPAQHQIHHSRLEQHWDVNYGRIFAIWDVVFGTLYDPEAKETMAFGLAAPNGGKTPRPHTSLVTAIWEPLTYAAQLVTGGAGLFRRMPNETQQARLETHAETRWPLPGERISTRDQAS